MTHFLVDVCVGTVIEAALREQLPQFLFTNVRDLDPRMADHDIIQLAYKERMVILTMDKDFGELAYVNRLKHCGIVLLRMDELVLNERIEHVIRLLAGHSQHFPDHFCVYQNGMLRIR